MKQKQFTVQFAKQGKDKTYWPIIGRAFEEDNRITVILDALPITTDWDGRMFLYPAKEVHEKV